MKTEKLFNEIGQIDDAIIAEADANTLKHKSVKHTWLRWTSAAAAFVAAVVGIVALYNYNTAPAGRVFPELPMLAVSNDSGSYGFEGYLAYDISELQNGNPWSESADIDTLPVFRNPVSYNGAGRPVNGGLTADEMMQKVKETASILGLTVDSVYTSPTEENLQKEREKEQSVSGNEDYLPDSTPYEAVAVCGDVMIKAEANGHIRIFFESGVKLPERYCFADYIADERQAADVTQYVLEQYAAVVAMGSPALSIFGDYNIYGQRSFSHTAYESGDSLVESILGFNFNQVKFSSNEKGELWIIDIYKDDISQKLGDYPIITAKEARELLVQGHYISNVIYTADTEQFPGEKYISSVELVYRNGRYDEVFMPYYRFLVELPSMERDNGLKNYGAFYVPAVDGRYLGNMPLWDGSFN